MTDAADPIDHLNRLIAIWYRRQAVRLDRRDVVDHPRGCRGTSKRYVDGFCVAAASRRRVLLEGRWAAMSALRPF